MSILIISGQSRFQLSYQHFFLKGLLIRKELAASLRTKLQTINRVGKCDSGMGVSDYCFTPNVQFVSCTMVRTSYIWWCDDVRFGLDQHTELDFYSASSLKQQSASRHGASSLKQQSASRHGASSLKQQSASRHGASSLKQQSVSRHGASSLKQQSASRHGASSLKQQSASRQVA